MHRPPELRIGLVPDELVIDMFAGAGGASVALEESIRRPVDYAINHNPVALAIHERNHPDTKHLCENVWAVNPTELVAGRRVAYLWASPDCTFHSRARGGKPLPRAKAARRRALASVVVRWAREVRPRIIFLENVQEFEDWGPLDNDGKPIKAKKGRSFRNWLGKLRAMGYHVEWRALTAADYGTPTSRTRLFLVARCDGKPIVWPEPTHGPGRAEPHKPAALCINWAKKGRSIFKRKKPLAEATMRRIAAGVDRFVLKAQPFLVKYHGGDEATQHQRIHPVTEPLRTVDTSNRFALVVPVIVPQYGGENGNQTAPRPLTRPMPTLTTRDSTSLVCAWLTKWFGTATAGASLAEPMPVVLTGGGKGGGHAGLVRAFLVKWYGTAIGQSVTTPLHTVTTKDRFGLVTIDGEDYAIEDITLRMLDPEELKLAHGFLPEYDLSPAPNQGAKTEAIGNSVCVQVARSIIEANIGAPPTTERYAPKRALAPQLDLFGGVAA